MNESAKASSDSSVVRSPDDVFLQSVDRIDSGFESTRSNLSPNFRKDRSGISKFPVEKGSCNTYKPPEKQSEVPWEVFLTGRKLSAAVYSQFLLEDKFEDRVFASKQSMPGRGKSIQIKPVLRVELVHPALIVNTQSSDPRIQVSCFDISITGPSTEKGTRFSRNFRSNVSVCVFFKMYMLSTFFKAMLAIRVSHSPQSLTLSFPRSR